MEKIFDYENPNLWSKHIKKIMDKYLNELLNISDADKKFDEKSFKKSLGAVLTKGAEFSSIVSAVSGLLSL